ncbi:MAG: ABC-type transporter, ATP-binding protein [Acidobacteria bacterium]|nr:ABC-type transporter, ATP-binding protein [Acidobacteriota bacterium]
MNTVEARSLTRRFGAFVAVDGADLVVRPGEIVGVLGANGAGKTTLMRMVLGLLAPTTGTVRLFGRPPSREVRRRIGYVPQGLGLYRDLTAAENLAFAAAAFCVAPEAVPAGTGAGVLGTLPLGQQRRVAFSAALQHHPELLVLDEPTSGVAPLARARLWDRVREQAAAGVAVLVTTHYMDEARQADRLVLMAAGRVVGEGLEADLVGSARAVVVRTPDWSGAFGALEAAGMAASLAGRDVRLPGADPAEVQRVLAAAGVPAEVASAPATLEEAMVLASRG